MATNSLHLTTFCLQYKPTVIACVCIHLACKWSNWEIPVSTDGKHWWEYVDNSVTLELLDELTHEFLQILEKTPSRLKRIRNWRATQAAKKPKSDNQGSDSSSLAGSSLTQDPSLMDALPGVSTSTAFSKASTSFPMSLSGNSSSSLSLDSIANMQGTSYTYTAPSDWPQDQLRSDPYSVKQLPSHSSMHPQRPDKSADFNPTKHEHKVSGGTKHQATTYPPPAAPTQKMSLDKYREKHAAELAVQKRKQEQQNVETEVYGATTQTDHRKHLPHLSHGQQGAGVATASPLKMKLPVPGQDKLQDKCEKGSSLKLRLPIPSQSEKGVSSKEELKMKIKVSSERHSSSDEGAAKSKHSSPLVSKEKHRDHSAHRHHHKHGHSHTHTHSGNGRSSLEVPATGSVADGPSSASSSSRKRVNPEASHNHHSKKNKSSKSGAGSSSHCSSVQQCVSSHNSVLNLPFPPPPVTYQVGYGHLSTLVKLDSKPVESHGPEGACLANGQHTDCKDTFVMLDSLLSAQAMNS
ncbi:cyclin-T2a isoform X3 [Danio aesculapii]|nr:cyclin-T2a isoform X3 [Danio aesculapii]